MAKVKCIGNQETKSVTNLTESFQKLAQDIHRDTHVIAWATLATQRRKISAPNCWATSIGAMVFPRDLDIFSPLPSRQNLVTRLGWKALRHGWRQIDKDELNHHGIGQNLLGKGRLGKSIHDGLPPRHPSWTWVKPNVHDISFFELAARWTWMSKSYSQEVFSITFPPNAWTMHFKKLSHMSNSLSHHDSRTISSIEDRK